MYLTGPSQGRTTHPGLQHTYHSSWAPTHLPLILGSGTLSAHPGLQHTLQGGRGPLGRHCRELGLVESPLKPMEASLEALPAVRHQQPNHSSFPTGCREVPQ